MNFLFKSLLSIATAAGLGSGGLLFTEDYFENRISKYDRALISYLEKGGKIRFKVLKGDSDLTGGFPNFTSSSDSISIVIKLEVTNNGSSSAGELEDGNTAKKEELVKLNGGDTETPWTWSCELKFSRNERSKSVTDIFQDVKDSLRKEETKGSTTTVSGFLHKLTEKNKEKDIKTILIEYCGRERSYLVNRKLNAMSSLKNKDDYYIKTANTLESTKEFFLAGEDRRDGLETKLSFESKREYWKWFEINPHKHKSN